MNDAKYIGMDVHRTGNDPLLASLFPGIRVGNLVMEVPFSKRAKPENHSPVYSWPGRQFARDV